MVMEFISVMRKAKSAMDREKIFADEKPCKYLWCLHCERAYKWGNFRLINNLQMCPYEGCNGDTVMDGWKWEEVCEANPDYPDVPELEKQVLRDAALLDQARAREIQAQARITTAEAELDAAEAAVEQAKTVARTKESYLKFREAQHHRYQELVDLKSIDRRMLDEQTDQRDAAQEAVAAARATIKTAEANVKAGRAKIKQTEADLIVESTAQPADITTEQVIEALRKHLAPQPAGAAA